MSMNKFFATADLSLAAVINLWFPLDSVNKLDNKKFEFLFYRNSEIDKIVDAYWRGELKVEPKQYFATLKILKSRIYEER